MKQFEVTYARMPTNYNQHLVKRVEANNAKDAWVIIANWLEERLMHKEYAVLDAREYFKPESPAGRILE